MISANDLQKRNIPLTGRLDAFLTARTEKVMDGTTAIFYLGSAHPGSAESAAVWVIQRVSIYGNESTDTLFANGKATFDQVWDDRASLSYS